MQAEKMEEIFKNMRLAPKAPNLSLQNPDFPLRNPIFPLRNPKSPIQNPKKLRWSPDESWEYQAGANIRTFMRVYCNKP